MKAIRVARHAEEEDEEDRDLLELARLLKQEEKVIRPPEERVEIVIPSTAEVRKEVKLEPLQRRVESRMVALLKGVCRYFRLVMSKYARVEHRCRCTQATMERRLSSKETERRCYLSEGPGDFVS
ncbi:hypothetical protein KIW84_033542 [Lathyrus oleraceus]|uniref:Uncharacterized protein n=1 Tax=Pisum sativum TaxID=3888 RepID=A0A9D4XYB8_PEA|nr:hypothetical protein KIW84_033542 [Pisum sativum]